MGSDSSNPYRGIPERQFKRANTVEEAKQVLPRAVQDITQRNKGDAYKTIQGIQGLGNIPITGFPSLQDTLGLSDYLQYLEKTQGSGSAANAVKRLGQKMQLREQKKALLGKASR